MNRNLVVSLATLGIAFSSSPAFAQIANKIASQCDGCDSKTAQAKIIAYNTIFVGQQWYSIDGATGSVTMYKVAANNEGPPSSITPRQVRGSMIFWLTPSTNDGLFNDVASKGAAWYNAGVKGWTKAYNVDGSNQAASLTQIPLSSFSMNKAGSAKISPAGVPVTVPRYPDGNVNVFNSIDAGRTEHNAVVNWVNQQTTVNVLSTVQDAFRGLANAISNIQVNNQGVTFGSNWMQSLTVVVPFQDGSKLSLRYTPDGWQTDPTFGSSTDSNGNAVPVAPDQVAGPNGQPHVYNYQQPKSWPTNPGDFESMIQRISTFSNQPIDQLRSYSPIIGCTNVGGGPLTCYKAQ